MIKVSEAMEIFARNEPCWSTAHGTRSTKCSYIVNGSAEHRVSCGDHLTRAIMELCETYGLHSVHVWRRP